MTNARTETFCPEDHVKFSNDFPKPGGRIYKSYLAGNSDEMSELQQQRRDDEGGGNSSPLFPTQHLPTSSKLTGRMLAVAMFSHLGVLSVGYDLGVTSGAVLQVREQMALSTGSQQLLVASTMPAAILMTLIGSYLADKIGRRYTIMCACTCYIFGGIIMASAFNLYMLLIGRFLVGMGIGKWNQFFKNKIYHLTTCFSESLPSYCYLIFWYLSRIIPPKKCLWRGTKRRNIYINLIIHKFTLHISLHLSG